MLLVEHVYANSELKNKRDIVPWEYFLCCFFPLFFWGERVVRRLRMLITMISV